MPGKKKNYVILAVLAAILLTVDIAALTWTPMKYEWAKLRFFRGEYEQAKKIYSTLSYKDSAEMITECDYRMADVRFLSGYYTIAKQIYDGLGGYKRAEIKALASEYMRLAGEEPGTAADTVKEIFSSLEEQQTETELLKKRDYMLASIAFAEDDLKKALPEYKALGDFADSPQWLEKCQEYFYGIAVDSMNRRDFGTAVENFDCAESYEQSSLYGNYCRVRLEKNDILDPDLILTPDHKVFIFDQELYYYSSAYIYAPEEVNGDTKFLAYFAGGMGEPMLFFSGVYTYIKEYSPNAILVFYDNSGIYNIEGSCRKMIDICNQLAAECGIAIHDLVVAGSSVGCYTALHAAAAFYTENFVAPKAVLTLDTGVDWISPEYNLSAEEREALAEAGTKLYLFEQQGVGTEVEAIYDLVASGDDVTMVYCSNEDHDWISRLAYENGVFSWAMGEFDELSKEEYTLVPLYL